MTSAGEEGWLRLNRSPWFLQARLLNCGRGGTGQCQWPANSGVLAKLRYVVRGQGFSSLPIKAGWLGWRGGGGKRTREGRERQEPPALMLPILYASGNSWGRTKINPLALPMTMTEPPVSFEFLYPLPAPEHACHFPGQCFDKHDNVGKARSRQASNGPREPQPQNDVRPGLLHGGVTLAPCGGTGLEGG